MAGMAEIGKAVDHRHAAVRGQSFYLCLLKGSDHDAVHIPGEHPGRVLYRLSPADLGALGVQHHRIAPQLIDAHLKGHPGTGGRLGKNHAQAFPLQVVVLNAVLGLIFQLIGQVQHLNDLLACHIQQLE